MAINVLEREKRMLFMSFSIFCCQPPTFIAPPLFENYIECPCLYISLFNIQIRQNHYNSHYDSLSYYATIVLDVKEQ